MSCRKFGLFRDNLLNACCSEITVRQLLTCSAARCFAAKGLVYFSSYGGYCGYCDYGGYSGYGGYCGYSCLSSVVLSNVKYCLSSIFFEFFFIG